jgi:DNA-directed RNA polymerase sigma subunit (sigma70/sigma32)
MAGGENRRDELRRRREAIAEAVRTRPDDSYETIGKEFGGISRERVRQIAVLYGVNRRRKPDPVEA